VYRVKRTGEQDIEHTDMTEARVLNEIMWFSVRGTDSPMPQIARLPAFDAMREGLLEDDDDEEEEKEEREDRQIRTIISKNSAS
jgi:hypothetical protein